MGGAIVLSDRCIDVLNLAIIVYTSLVTNKQNIIFKRNWSIRLGAMMPQKICKKIYRSHNMRWTDQDKSVVVTKITISDEKLLVRKITSASNSDSYSDDQDLPILTWQRKSEFSTDLIFTLERQSFSGNSNICFHWQYESARPIHELRDDGTGACYLYIAADFAAKTTAYAADFYTDTEIQKICGRSVEK